MPTFLDNTIWALTILVPLYVCGHALLYGYFRCYVALNHSMFPVALLSPSRLNVEIPTLLLGCGSPLARAYRFTRISEGARPVPGWVALRPPR